MRKILSCILLLMTLSSWAGGSFLINEFQYDPDSNNGDANGDGTSQFAEDEFVEIFNNTGADVDITGWTISDGSGVTHTFPSGSVILDQCAVVVFGGGMPTGFFGGSIVQTASSGGLELGNSGDSLTLNDGLTDVASASYVDNQSDNESLTRDPDIIGTGFVSHSGATGSGGALFSPGTQIDGSQFSGCPVAVDVAPQVVSTLPADNAEFVAVDSNITINFDENIDATGSAVTLTCDAASVPFMGLPFSGSALVITPDADFNFDASCAVNVVATEVTDQDGSVDAMAQDYAFSFTVRAVNSPLIINEFQYDPAGDISGDANGDGVRDSADDEFVELYNVSGADLDVSGWTVSDSAQVKHVFPAQTVIPANCALVVFGGGSPTGTFGDALVQTASGSNGLGLNNGGDSIIVRTGNNEITSFAFDGEASDQAATLDPDITGLNYVEHSTATGSGGSLFSPGSLIDGTNFAGCVAADVPPQVVSTAPADQAVDVAIDSNVLINFNETVDLAMNAVDVLCSISGQQQFPMVATAGVNSIDIDSSDFANLDECTVTVLAASVTDVDGTPDQLDGNGDGIGGDNYVFSFDVISSDTVPTVVATNPLDGSVGFSNDADLSVGFSEDITATSDAVTLQCSQSGQVSVAGLPVVNPSSQIIIDPDSNLINSETCDLTVVATEVTDADGDNNNLAANVVVSFTVGFPTYEIFEIQGSGLASPFDGVTVSTINNVVTGVGGNGFYIQTPDARDDGVLATSNGIFVFTGGAPTVAVGDGVDVTGEVIEFNGLTEFSSPGSQVINVVSQGNPLPAALILDDSFPSPDPTIFDCGDAMLERECFEGMYFEMERGHVAQASAGFFSFFDRTDMIVNAGTDRAFREPGIDFPGLPDLPVFDGNPELIEMSIEALNLDYQALSAGTVFSAKGVMTSNFGDYELQPTELIIIDENVIPGPVRDATIDEFTLASANIQRFFDDIDDPGTEDDGQVEDSMVYANRLLKLADYVVNDLNAPTIIGLQEIENLNVLSDLIAAISTAGGPAYTAALIDGNDQGGIDVAYLYQTDLLSNVVITQLGLNELNDFDQSLLHDRPPLRLAADMNIGNVTFPVNVLVVHMRSRGGIDDNSDGERVRSKRLQQANSVAAMAVDILTTDPNTPLYIIGDFNAFQFTDGYVDVVGQITGTAVEADNLLYSQPLLANTPLTQAVQTLAAEQQYSFVFRGSAQILDNALMNDVALMSFNEIQFVRGQADANVNFEDDSSSLRSTDHDGFVLFVQGNDDLIFKNGYE